MEHKKFPVRTWTAAACALGAMVWLPVHAQSLNFENTAPALYLDGDSFAQSGYTFTVDGDFGLVDSLDTCPTPSCPIGNATQFYFGANDGHLVLSRGGAAFTLTGFDAAYLTPQPRPAGTNAGMIVLVGKNALGATVANASFAFAVSTAAGFAFQNYTGAGLAGFGNVFAVDFSACTYVGAQCVNVNANLSQFALDNVQVVPEPPALLLMGLGLAALAGSLRRRHSATAV